MEKVTAIVLIVCGVILMYLAAYIYGSPLYTLCSICSVALLIIGIVKLVRLNRKRKAEAANREVEALSQQMAKPASTSARASVSSASALAAAGRSDQPGAEDETIHVKVDVPSRIGSCILVYNYAGVRISLLNNTSSVFEAMAKEKDLELTADYGEDDSIVLSHKGTTCAVLRGREDMVSDWLDRGDPFLIYLDSYKDGAATVHIIFYRDEQKRLSHRESQVVRLTRYANEDAQIGLIGVKSGDKVELSAEYDARSGDEYVAVDNGFEIGALPKAAANRYLSEGAAGAFIDHVDYDIDKDKSIPYVIIYW